ncbi:DUF1292 domain-containing protein [Bacillus dakarensis]|uniref:DUF1292 domain-containing protein n=1 Tax=Robertmurraya dakarensis TaxID=1926278 RepID=UPI001F19BB14|nr:DUF1292 domain-containing protein [Bacillus dakarensis]
MMKNDELRDYITVTDENGQEQQFAVEALFDIKDKTYALLRSAYDQDDTFIMQVEEDENGQHLIGLDNADDKEMLLDAYEIAVDANPAE